MSPSREDDRAEARDVPRDDLRIERLRPPLAVRIAVDGEELAALDGDSIAVALHAAGRRVLGWTVRRGEPRGYFCGTGICRQCLVTVDGQPDVRACVTPVRDGLRVDRLPGPADRTAAT